jgi:hypothetical protein
MFCPHLPVETGVAICYIFHMSSMPMRIDGELIKEARASGTVFHRSIAQQLEHWANLGKVLESVLTVRSVAHVKSLKKPVGLDRLLARARSPEGKRRTLALLAKKKGPLYGVKANRPGVMLQYQPDGKTVAGRMSKGVFVPARNASRAKAPAPH